MSTAPKVLMEQRLSLFALGLCLFAAGLPIVVATLPPIMDFPNHLARIWLIARGATEAPLDQIYQIDWTKAGANVGVDLVAASAMRALPVYVVGKALVALAFLGPALGGLALNRRLAGRFHPLQLAFLALIWSTTAIAGFVNFQISLGLALLFAAFTPPRGYAAPVLFATILLFVHPFGLALYAAAVAALRIGPQLPDLKTCLRLAPSLAGLALAVAAPVAAIMLLMKSGARPPVPFWGDAANIVDPAHILTIWASPVLSYDLTIDLAAAGLVLALLIYALASGAARVHAGLTFAAAALFALAPFAPDAVGDGSWLPHRMPIMAALLFLSGLRPGVAPRLWLPAALAAPILARTFWIASVWMARQDDITALQQTLRAIPPGSAVIALQQEPLDWRKAPAGRFMIGSPNGMRATGRHLGALAVIEARAFIPTLFSVPGQHPLSIQPAWRDISVEASSIPYPRQLGETLAGDPYLKDWRARFDYVLVLNADLPSASGLPAQAELETVADHGFARLYRIPEPVSVRDDAQTVQ